jgi:D-serine deaminase-like pyridoxal phosphate-dependent protein
VLNMPPTATTSELKTTQRRDRFDHATATLDTPLAIVDLEAFDANADALTVRAAGKPLRVASKSVRCRELLRRVLRRPGWSGVLGYTLPEAIWLVRGGVTQDVVVAYPTVDRAALRELAGDAELARCVTLTVDSRSHLDFIDSVVAPERRHPIRLSLEIDASWRLAGGRLHIGVRRSPVHTPEHAGELAARIAARRGFTLVGVMSYEAQIAGVGDRPAGAPVRGAAIRTMQRRSLVELVARRGAAIAAVRRHADLEFVNGGGTGSVARTAADPAITEIAAGSGLFGPVLFDAYRAWRPEPAAYFGLSVVRRPGPGIATVLGGGWIASGPAERARLPVPTIPAGLRTTSTEGAGEVQTPLVGPGADRLRIGDRVWFRHAKAGELSEHVNELHLLHGEELIGTVPTYRGEQVAFL